ncbi:MAG: DUF4956 domain-containing protein [Myxococcales bacterium]|nr:DUF4956 domain-containing protein [Myxococcales bacterium]
MENLLLSFGSMKLEWSGVLLSFLVTFLCSSLVAATYEKTFQGLSWSRGLLHTMILGSLTSSLIMIAIGDNVARGIGIVGSLAIIRFRTNLRDPRDLIFLFVSMGVGVASGVQSYISAILGTAFFCLVAIGLNRTQFGRRYSHDGLVRFQVPAGPTGSEQVARVMSTIPAHFALVTMRSAAQGDVVDYAYQVRLAREGEEGVLLRELEGVSGIRGLVYVNQQTTVEL